MKFCSEAWLTLYNGQFNNKKYFYHYTSFEKAIMILCSKRLRFSQLYSLNDTLEWKPKLSNLDFSESSNYTACEKHFREYGREHLQLLCFSKDGEYINKECNERQHYCDFTGRGFALPRMWAQYASNNSGVCFLFDREKLIEHINEDVGVQLLYHDDVSYVEQFDSYHLDETTLIKLVDYINKHGKTSQIVQDYTFLINNKDFVKYNYFSKLSDWSNENEYRFLACGDQENVFYINNITDAIVGLVIGEETNREQEGIIKTLVDEQFEIQKIKFSYNGISLTTVY